MNKEEKLKDENDFLKMKLMLEHGARFSEQNPDQPLSPTVENEFLNHIVAFQEQSNNPKYIRVFDRIECPAHFKPVAEIPDEEIDNEWEKLQDHLYKYHIRLDVCSPNITIRELYRFTVEELFEHEMNDMDIPGMTTNFIYDEFHPDPVYDNSRAASFDCIHAILQKEPLEWVHHFRKKNLRLNNHFPLTTEELKTITSRFKDSYDALEVENAGYTACDIDKDTCVVTGAYTVIAMMAHESVTLGGNWTVKLELDKEWGYWYIYEMQIEGIDF